MHGFALAVFGENEKQSQNRNLIHFGMVGRLITLIQVVL